MATKKKSNVSKKNNNSKKSNVKKNKGNVTKKNIQDEKNKIDQVNSDFNTNIWHYVTVGACVLIFICLFYLLTLYITSKNSDDTTTGDEETTTSEISYSEIMVGRSFSISDGEYFVIYYDKNDDEIYSSCSSAVSSYKSKDDHLDIYTVNMGDGLNKSYAKEESNHNPTNASEIAINGPTLIKFNDGEVVDYIEGIDEITEYLQ